MNCKATVLGAALVAAMLTAPRVEAATPAAGVEQQIRSGFYADINMGGFFTVGGKSVMTGLSKPSNAQAYLQLGVGYDVLKNVAVGASLGLGSSAAACYSVVSSSGSCVRSETDKTIMADNFTVTMFAGHVSYKHFFNSRFSVLPRLNLGYASLDPEPMFDGETAINGGLLAGLGAGVEYATHMDHFSIGFEVDWRMVVGPNMHTLSFYPKIKYTF